MTLQGQKLTKQLMQDKKREYRSLSEEEFMRYKELGRLATQQHADGAETFPCKSRRAESGRGRRGHHIHRVPHLEDAEGAEAFEKRVLAGQAANLPQVPTMHGKPFKQAFECYLHNQAAYCFERKAANARREAQLRDTLYEHEAVRRETILQYRRGLAEIPHVSWVSLPHDCPALAAQFVPESAVPAVWERGDGGQDPDSLLELESTWKRQSFGIKGSDWQGRDPGHGGKRSECAQACVCHCGRDWAIPRLLHSRLRQHFNGLIAGDATLRPNILNGYMILQWSFSDPDRAVSARMQSEGAAGAPTCAGGCKHFFTHVALCYLRPWRPTFVPVRLADAEVEQKLMDLPSAEVVGPLVFKASEKENGEVAVSNVWNCLKQLDTDKRVTVQFWELSKRRLPTASLLSVVARKAAIPAFTLWSGPDAELLRRPQRPAHEILEEAKLTT